MSAPELKPCPFCGGEAALIVPAGSRPYVMCATRFCSGPQNSAEIAIAAWNTRADLPPTLEQALAVPEVQALVEAAQWARNRLELIADESWYGDGRDLKRSIIGVFADFDEALFRCGSFMPAALKGGAA